MKIFFSKCITKYSQFFLFLLKSTVIISGTLARSRSNINGGNNMYINIIVTVFEKTRPHEIQLQIKFL